MTNGNKFGKLLGSLKQCNNCVCFYLIVLFRFCGMVKQDNNLNSPALMNGMVKLSHPKPLLHPKPSKKLGHCTILLDPCLYNFLFKSQGKWVLES